MAGQRPHVLIVGGGYVGMYTALRLQRRLRPGEASVTVVDAQSYMTYQPFLPEAAAGNLEPRHVVVPLREHLERTDLLLGRVTGADPDARNVFVTTAEGQDRALEYDQLIVTLGSVSRTLPVPGLREYAVGFKTLSDAIALRNQIIHTLERAESVDDEEHRRALLTYVFVGAGYAGLEGLAELQDFAADVVDLYPRSRVEGLRFILVEARDRVMPEISADLAAFATSELRKRGIDVRTGTTVERISADSVELSDGEVVPCRTVAWTAGVRPAPVIAEMGLPLDGTGRIVVDRYCKVEGREGVWAIGDCAAVPDPAKPGSAAPPTCQHALRQGRTVAGNVAAALGAGRPKPFTYKTLGVFVDMGHQKAVAETVGIKWRGFPAWFLARTYHLAMMPGTSRKLRLVVDWTVDLLFGRDTSELGQLGHPPVLDATTAGGTSVEDPPAVRH
jgi:NADH:ubiquinone reductase (H+-translocating)